MLMAGARGIEPRSWVLETHILTVVLCPFKFSYEQYCNRLLNGFIVLQKR